MQTTALFPGMDVAVAACDGVRVNDNGFAAPRLRRSDRQQTTLEPCRVDDRLPGDHPARTIWKVVEGLDLSAFYTPIAARGSDPGRAATAPKLLVALWPYAAVEGVAIYVPLSPTAGEGRVCTEHKGDPPGVAAWRKRMMSEEGKAIYKLRGLTSETVNADLKTFRGLQAFTVRGLAKVRCVAPWSAPAYNVMHFATALMS
jgi:hypothetical protein